MIFFFNDTATTELYTYLLTLSLHDALPIFGLALLGDIVLASSTATFTTAYTGIGLSPDGGVSWLLPRLIGLRAAQRMMILNQSVAADEALKIGLVTRVLPAEDLAAEVAWLARELGGGTERPTGGVEVGRAAGRVRGGPYGWIWVGAGPENKQDTNERTTHKR